MENEPKPVKKVKPGTLKAQRAAEWNIEKARLLKESQDKWPGTIRLREEMAFELERSREIIAAARKAREE